MLRVPAAAEGGLWALVRWAIAHGGPAQRLGEAVVDVLRPPERAEPALPGQRALWVVDAEGLPPRPWRVRPDDRFDCIALGCRSMRVGTCVARQQATDAQRTEQTSRGQGTEYPACDSRRCAQGRGLREALDPHAATTWRGRGPGGRFDRGAPGGPKALGAQLAARARQDRVGLLAEVRILDVHDDPPEET